MCKKLKSMQNQNWGSKMWLLGYGKVGIERNSNFATCEQLSRQNFVKDIKHE